MKRLFFVAVVCGICGVVLAQTVEPALLADVGLKGKKKLVKLGVSDIKVEAKIFGYIAETAMTMTFVNPHSRALAGDLYFPLPEGSTVSGYALDINGVMVDGVVVEKRKGRQVFEKIVRQGIDPGLVEWTKGNNFKTRVFPIPAKGSRTVMVKYVADLVDSEGQMSYHLPLNFKDRINSLSLKVEVVKAVAKPRVAKGGLVNFAFKKWRDSFVAEAVVQDMALTEDLVIALPDVAKRKVLVERAPDGEVYFCINDLPPRVVTEPGPSPRRITLLWDASGSRAKTDHACELKLLESFFRGHVNIDIDVELIVFRNAPDEPAPFSVRHGDCGQLLKAVGKVRYDGGTQMGCLSPQTGANVPDFYLLFTDGLSNFGIEDPSGLRKPVYIVSGDATANHSFLRYLAMRTGGEYFNLNRIEDKDVLAGIGNKSFVFLSGTADAGVAALYPGIAQPVHRRLAVAGKLTSDEARITLNYGIDGDILRKTIHTVSRADAVAGDLLMRFWAQKKVEDLQIFPKRNEKEIVSVGKRYSIVTPGTSLIVLDSLEQYVEHRIAPPACLPDMLKEYKKTIVQQEKKRKKQRENKIKQVLKTWKERVAWWAKEFKYPKDFRYKKKRSKQDEPDAAVASLMAVGGEGDLAEAEAADGSVSFFVPAVRQSAGEAEKSKEAGSKGAAPEPAIVMKQWDPKTPYLAKLKKAKKEQRLDLYLAQRRDYGVSPSFYLDCADFFIKQDDCRLGMQVLSNIAELELENESLLRILAHKLAQINELDLSIMLFEEVLQLRPEEPQSYRDLALVLARRADVGYRTAQATRDPAMTAMNNCRADYRRAIELLYEVVTKTWDRFAEIELIALAELNALIPKAKQAGMTDIDVDKRLVKLLDMDVRIVMTWHADATDIDLWVTEPSGEKALYSHNRTTIGGSVSRDFTQGYGPEEYSLRKAMNGMYKIQANYYGSSAAKLIGAVTLQVDVFTHYGRENQKSRSITLRLEAKKETVDVGEIEF